MDRSRGSGEALLLQRPGLRARRLARVHRAARSARVRASGVGQRGHPAALHGLQRRWARRRGRERRVHHDRRATGPVPVLRRRRDLRDSRQLRASPSLRDHRGTERRCGRTVRRGRPFRFLGSGRRFRRDAPPPSDQHVRRRAVGRAPLRLSRHVDRLRDLAAPQPEAAREPRRDPEAQHAHVRARGLGSAVRAARRHRRLEQVLRARSDEPLVLHRSVLAPQLQLLRDRHVGAPRSRLRARPDGRRPDDGQHAGVRAAAVHDGPHRRGAARRRRPRDEGSGEPAPG